MRKSSIQRRTRETIEIVARQAGSAIEPNTTGGFWFLVPWDSAQTPWLTMRTHWSVDADRNLFTKALSTLINRELHFDGIWIVGWTDWDYLQAIPTRMFMALFDSDGDMNVFVDCEDPWWQMAASMDHYVESCARAFQRFQEHDKEMEIRPSDKILAAKGQKSANPHVFPAYMPQMFD
jgi:hypothetical protein